MIKIFLEDYKEKETCLTMGRKRKIELNTYTNESSNSSQSHLNIVQRSAANDRERTRMRVLSKAFVKLKTSLPWVPSDTKLSKLDTLKLATSYISYLTKILEDDELAQNLNTQQGSLTTQISNNEDDKKNNEYQGNNVYPSFSGTSASNGFVSSFK